jgi:DNA-binding YbaB/EbfC family protein
MDMNMLMRQAQNMQRQLEKKKKEVEEKEFVVTSNGGAITVTIMGNKKVNKIEIDEDLLDDKDMLQDLLTVAMNEAIKKVDDEMNKVMNEATGGMRMPGMF